MKTSPRSSLTALAALAAGAFLSGQAAQAQGALVMYCGVQEEWCRAMVDGFEKETGIKVSMTRKSSGEIYAQVKAEAANPRGDIWWGGTGDPHMQAAEEGLTRRVQVAGAARTCRTGRCGNGSSRRTAPSASTPARSASATTPTSEEEGPRRAEMLGRPARSEAQGRGPGRRSELVRHRLHAARDDRADDGRGQGLRLSQEACTRTSTSTPSRAPRRPRPRASARPRSASLSCTTGDDDRRQARRSKTVPPCEGTGYEIGSMSLIKGAKQSRQREEVLRLGADRRRRRSSAPRRSPIRCPRTRHAGSAAGAEARRDQADRFRLRQIRLLRRSASGCSRNGTARSRTCRNRPCRPWRPDAQPVPRAASIWLALGWHRLRAPALASGSRPASARAGSRPMPRDGAASAARLGCCRTRRCWLAAAVLPLLAATLAAGRAPRAERPHAGRRAACSASRCSLAAGLRDRPPGLELARCSARYSASRDRARPAWDSARR